ncbi:HAAS domain-containing protein [Oceanobacillus sp. CFH 90083]|uniref:HAAS signaling domain-containing protein n=1 Tax=Oceanobacillus sp. CFH 90083 TaxID=2592336 RepID=UPI00128D83DC|nr:DUF1700 domain-containing protein [Oceanobacillus sp. CFH 90083]
MNKSDFIGELTVYLQDLSPQEQEEIIQDFEEHFEMGRAEGKTDEEIYRSLGSPQQIAKELQSTQPFAKARKNHAEQSPFHRIGIIIGLLFFNLIIVLGPSIGIAGIILSAWVVAFSFIAQLLIAIVQWIVQPDSFYLFELFTSVTLTGSGLFIFIGANYMTNAAIRMFSKYIAFNVRLVKGENHT